jgi:hypothetical protein
MVEAHYRAAGMPMGIIDALTVRSLSEPAGRISASNFTVRTRSRASVARQATAISKATLPKEKPAHINARTDFGIWAYRS